MSQLNLINQASLDSIEVFNESTDSVDAQTQDLNIQKEQFHLKKVFPEMILIIDTETTGLDPIKDNCIEIGAILFHVDSRNVIAQQSFLLPVDLNPAERINKIPAFVSKVKQPWKEGLKYLNSLVEAADLLVAHNAAFDSQWFGKEPLPKIVKPWLCTMEDISWSLEREVRSRPSVRDLALAYEIPVWSAHRALTDCIYLAEIFRRCDDLNCLLKNGLEPKVLVQANVSYDQRQLAKDAGFRWNDPIKGAWVRRMSKRDAAKLDFAITILEEED